MKTLILPPKTLPKTFAGLAEALVPLVRDEASHEEALPMLDRLAVTPLNSEQQQYLEVLTDQVERYEEEHGPQMPKRMSGLQALKYILEEAGMTGDDLARLLRLHRSAAFRLLAGERALTVAHIRRLCDYFRVSADLFVQ